MNVYLVGAVDRQLEELLHASGLHTTMCALDGLSNLATQSTFQADVVVLDLRERSTVPASVAHLKGQHPLTGIVIVAASMNPVLMLEALGTGVTESVTEPVTQGELKGAIDRVAAK